MYVLLIVVLETLLAAMYTKFCFPKVGINK